LGSKRPSTIVILSILFYIFGAIGLGSSFFAFVVIPYVSLVPFIGWLSAGILMVFALIGVIIGILDIVAGYYLWNLRKTGAIVGIIACGLSLAFSIPLIPVPMFTASALINVVFDIMLLALIISSWSMLK